MQWKQKKKKSFQKSTVGDADNAEDSELKFSQEELDVPKERLFKSKKSGKLKVNSYIFLHIFCYHGNIFLEEEKEQIRLGYT